MKYGRQPAGEGAKREGRLRGGGRVQEITFPVIETNIDVYTQIRKKTGTGLR